MVNVQPCFNFSDEIIILDLECTIGQPRPVMREPGRQCCCNQKNRIRSSKIQTQQACLSVEKLQHSSATSLCEVWLWQIFSQRTLKNRPRFPQRKIFGPVAQAVLTYPLGGDHPLVSHVIKHRSSWQLKVQAILSIQ